MNKRIGTGTLIFESMPEIASAASVVGDVEGKGPLAPTFDVIAPDEYYGEATFELAESKFMREAATLALSKAEVSASDVDLMTGGDLLNQCIASTFGLLATGAPFMGLFGACATIAQSLILSAMAVDGGYAQTVLAASSSHFCTAERQFRTPLEYGSQRPPSAQRTVTGSGAFVLRQKSGNGVRISKGVIGKMVDMGIVDPANMGAAMAPSAVDTLLTFFNDTGTSPTDYDLIATGDLGYMGAELTRDLAIKQGVDLGESYTDCGLLIYDRDKQDVQAGGSGCGCSSVVLAGDIYSKLLLGEYKRVILAGTGALMSTVSSMQGQPIVGISHLIELCGANQSPSSQTGTTNP